MARVCVVCSNGTSTGNNKPFSKKKTKRKFKKNIQSKTIEDKDGNKQKIKICAGCYRTFKNKKLPEGISLGEYVRNNS